MSPSVILSVLRAVAAPGLPSRQGILILCAVYHGPASIEDIARLTNIKPGTVKTIASTLKKDGLLETDDYFMRTIAPKGKDLVDSICDCTQTT